MTCKKVRAAGLTTESKSEMLHAASHPEPPRFPAYSYALELVVKLAAAYSYAMELVAKLATVPRRAKIRT